MDLQFITLSDEQSSKTQEVINTVAQVHQDESMNQTDTVEPLNIETPLKNGKGKRKNKDSALPSALSTPKAVKKKKSDDTFQTESVIRAKKNDSKKKSSKVNEISTEASNEPSTNVEEESLYRSFLRGRDRIVDNLQFGQKLYILSKILKDHELRECFNKPIPAHHGLFYDSSSDEDSEDRYEAKLTIPRIGQIKSFLKMTLNARQLKNPSRFYELLSKHFFRHLVIAKCISSDTKEPILPDVDDMISLVGESRDTVVHESHELQQVPWSPSRIGGGKGFYMASVQHMYIVVRMIKTLTFQDILFSISRDIDSMNTYTKDDLLTTHFYGKINDPSGWVFDHEPHNEIEVLLPPTAEFPSFLKRLRENYSIQIRDMNSFEEKFATFFKNAASH